MKKIVYILTIILLVLVFVISAFFVGKYIIESREQANKNEELAALKTAFRKQCLLLKKMLLQRLIRKEPLVQRRSGIQTAC